MKRTGHWGILSIVALICAFFAIPLHAAAPAKPIILKFAGWTPPQHPFSRMGAWIVHEIEQRSDGRIKVEYYWSNSLVPAAQLIDALQKGVADIAYINPAYQPGKMPLMSVISIGVEDVCPSAKALQELVQMPEVKAEFDALNIRYLGPLTNNSYGVWTKSKQVRTITDLKGLKLRAVGNHANLLHALGGVPVSMPPTDIYQAIEKGTLDGALGNPSFALGYKWDEVTKYYNPISFGGLGQFVAINKNSWAKLPPDIQKRLDAIHDMACGAAQEIYQGGGDVLLQEAVAKGRTIVTQPSAEDIARMREVTKAKIASEWVAKMNSRGLPGQKVLDRWMQLLAKWHGEAAF